MQIYILLSKNTHKKSFIIQLVPFGALIENVKSSYIYNLMATISDNGNLNFRFCLDTAYFAKN